MILEIDDERELKLSDDVSDDVARQLKRLILAVEARAAAEPEKPKADPRLDKLEGEIEALKKKLNAPKPVVKRKKYGARK